MGAAQSLERAGLPVELFSPTAKAHAEEWPILAQRLASRTLVLPPHARLREELLNLVVEVGPQGVRVIDRGQVHQDHAVAVRGVVAAFAARGDNFLTYLEAYQPRTPEQLREAAPGVLDVSRALKPISWGLPTTPEPWTDTRPALRELIAHRRSLGDFAGAAMHQRELDLAEARAIVARGPTVVTHAGVYPPAAA
jgi:LmbE family N-acetylglucosaminyl deacetylase